MPHIRLEYTNNIDNELHIKHMLLKLQDIICEIANADKANCMSRAIKLDNYLIGNDDVEFALLHLEIQLLQGRDGSVLNRLGTTTLNYLQKCSNDYLKQFNVKVNVKIFEIPNNLYFK